MRGNMAQAKDYSRQGREHDQVYPLLLGDIDCVMVIRDKINKNA